jgi:hypothetical protein
MRATDAIAIATEWVREQGGETTGYRGAWFTGSVCWMHDDEQLNPSSDVDITIIVRADAMPNAKPGKFRHRGILLEVTLAPDTMLDDQDIALNAPIASSIARNCLIDDPEGILVPWFERVGQTFRRRDTIITRIRTQADTIRQRTGSIDSSAPFHRQILWLFPATLATSLPILAELGNPTVRKRFLAARHVLDRHGFHDAYERLLTVYGFDRVTPEEVTTWLGWLTDLYDLAQNTPTTSTWRQDVDRDSRAISIDGTRDLISAGDHREATWWIIATFARALDVLANATKPVDASLHDHHLRVITSQLGLGDRDALLAATARLHAFLPELEAVALTIVDHNQDATTADPREDPHPAKPTPTP